MVVRSSRRTGSTCTSRRTRQGSASLDLWVARRESTDDPWGNPANLNDEAGADLNTSADEFCPTPVRGNGLFFVPRPSSCGLGAANDRDEAVAIALDAAE